MGIVFACFFYALYIAGIGESLIKAIFGCLLFSFVFTFVSLSAQKGDWLDAEICCVSHFSLSAYSTLDAYLAHQAKSEKRRADDAERAKIVKRRLWFPDWRTISRAPCPWSKDLRK